MKKVLIVLLCFPLLSFGQDCDCTSTFNWVKETFEHNDAGFQYIVDKKGTQAYSLHNKLFTEQIVAIVDHKECEQQINEWLRFFRKGHIGLVSTLPIEQVKTTLSNQMEVSNNQSLNWETYNVDKDKYKTYLDQKTDHDYEGIWVSGPYEIGIKKEGEKYIGFIIKSAAENWTEGQVKLTISTKNNAIDSKFYMRDRSLAQSDKVDLIGKNHLQVGQITLTRSYPKLEELSSYDLHFKSIGAQSPFLERINQTTLYFRIPSFSGTPEKIEIDSVIAANKEIIQNTENLIIDIRNGTGGMDHAYYELLPIIYTDPIRSPVVEFRSTVLNNQRMLDLVNNTGIALDYNFTFDEEQKQEFRDHFVKLSKSLGEFVTLNDKRINITTFDTVYHYPKKVGIIHNQNNGSTDEQFLLDAKQSKKVKLFGRPTMGSLDVSNLNKAVSPCEDFELWYTLSKSLRIPEMAIDEIGIQPDYYIDSEIPEYKWIKYVNQILNQ